MVRLGFDTHHNPLYLRAHLLGTHAESENHGRTTTFHPAPSDFRVENRYNTYALVPFLTNIKLISSTPPPDLC